MTMEGSEFLSPLAAAPKSFSFWRKSQQSHTMGASKKGEEEGGKSSFVFGAPGKEKERKAPAVASPSFPIPCQWRRRSEISKNDDSPFP